MTFDKALKVTKQNQSRLQVLEKFERIRGDYGYKGNGYFDWTPTYQN